MAVTVPVPHVQLLNVLVLIFFVGPSEVVIPSVFTHPRITVAPVMVMLLKLLLVWEILLPGPEAPVPESNNVTDPPAAVFEKKPVILLLVQVSV